MIGILTKNKLLILLFILLIPSFWIMLKPGIFSMQDFPAFRFYEFEKCFNDFQLPCRWSPDASFGYGQPLFNFYGQLSFLIGQFFRIINFSIIDSVKLLFITSLVGSAMGMFLLSKRMWNNNLIAIVCSVFYVYAPYRAVDVYVRGALPEAVTFSIMPFLVYFLDKFLIYKKNNDLIYFSIFFSILILTHNLSVILFLPVLLVWVCYRFFKNRSLIVLLKLALVAVLIFCLSAFYILPVIFESRFVTLEKTIQGYFDYHNHFVTLSQLLISRFWGYGASVWGSDDGLSLSIGQMQWIVPLILLLFLVVQKKMKQNLFFLLLLATGWLMLFLTHNRSTFIWQTFPPLSYVQFPWRFLGPALFCFSLAAGVLINVLGKEIKVALIFLILLVVLTNVGFFHEDLWFNTTDKQFFEGQSFKNQQASSAFDYWPKYGNRLPDSLASEKPILDNNLDKAVFTKKKTNFFSIQTNIKSEKIKMKIPVVYFPGWTGEINSKQINIYPDQDLGLITTNLTKGNYMVNFYFKDTWPRLVGNIISMGAWILILLTLIIMKFKKYVQR